MEKKVGIEPPQQVVRSLVVSLAPKDKLWDDIIKGTTIHALQFYVGKKKDRYTLLGGKVNGNEVLDEAAQREVLEEAGVTPMGLPTIRKQIIGEPFIYRIGTDRYRGKKRVTLLIYTPILPPKNSIVPGEGVESIVALSFNEFSGLIITGELDGLPMEGHVSLQPNDSGYTISKEEKGKQEKSLKRAHFWMGHIEDHFVNELKKQSFKDIGEFTVFYEQLLARLMKNGLDAGEKQKDTKNVEEHRAIEAVMSSGHLGKDVLYFLPTIARNGLKWDGVTNATEGVQEFLRYSQNMWTSFCKGSITEYTLVEMEQMLKNRDTTLMKDLTIRTAFNVYVQQRIQEDFSLTAEEVDQVARYTHSFLKDISTELNLADHSLAKEGIYQPANLTNENANASIGSTLLNFMGMHTSAKTESAELLQFEAGRQWLLFLKAASGIKSYNKECAALSDNILSTAINKYFGGTIRTKSIPLGGDKMMRVNVRSIGDDSFIVDQKPQKPFSSFLRKIFFEKAQDIHDLLAYSIVLEGSSTGRDTASASVKKMQSTKSLFLKYLEEQLGANSVVESQLKETTAYYQEEINDGKSVKASGKRVGSVGALIPRIKSIVTINIPQGPNIVQAEIAFYPFESIPEGTFMGWIQKIQDDPYYAARRMFAGENGIPPFYSLLYPVEIYPLHYQALVRNSTYHKG